MSEWHVTPDYIINNWTDELFALMIRKLSERKEFISSGRPAEPGEKQQVSEEAFFQQAGNIIKVVHK